ncbi:hypothetical protein [Methanobrevibacter sp.]|uniref:hypothetical protein n=1 Tax=Methanobrevibacter sp. TaxID=66852 RepID=UPI003D7E6C8F
MKILNITAKKQKLGYEDIVVGTGHIQQTRSNITKKFYHKINLRCNMGLLNDCDFNNIPNDLEEIYFTGYYKEGDKGEGIYRYIGNDTTHNVGIYISNGTRCWKRDFTEYVRPEWFGAYGDGKHDDADAFIIALIYGSIELAENAYYKCELLQTNIIPISKNIDILGNNATVEINSILDSNKLIFRIIESINIKMKFVRFKSNLSKIFDIIEEQLVVTNKNIKYCEFSPSNINPFSVTEYLTQQGTQTLTTTILEGRNYKTQVATNDLHPLNKNDLKSLKIEEEVPNAVQVAGDVKIESLKVFYKNPIGPKATEENQIVTLAQMKELVKLPQSIKDIIDTKLNELKERKDININVCPYPVSACYIQPHGTKTPKELWPDTNWVKIEYNDGALLETYMDQIYDGTESINI